MEPPAAELLQPCGDAALLDLIRKIERNVAVTTEAVAEFQSFLTIEGGMRVLPLSLEPAPTYFSALH